MKKQGGFIVFWFALLAVCVGGVGWIWNIVKIIDTCCAVIDGMLVMRIIGIFIAPIGAIVGYF